jgi:hypothetical protein
MEKNQIIFILSRRVDHRRRAIDRGTSTWTCTRALASTGTLPSSTCSSAAATRPPWTACSATSPLRPPTARARASPLCCSTPTSSPSSTSSGQSVKRGACSFVLLLFFFLLRLRTLLSFHWVIIWVNSPSNEMTALLLAWFPTINVNNIPFLARFTFFQAHHAWALRGGRRERDAPGQVPSRLRGGPLADARELVLAARGARAPLTAPRDRRPAARPPRRVHDPRQERARVPLHAAPDRKWVAPRTSHILFYCLSYQSDKR